MEKVLLHACCAPCSSAILEWMLSHEISPILFYYNPNIYPDTEYEIRKNELTTHAKRLGVEVYEGNWEHDQWRQAVKGLEEEPERGARCLECFKMRLLASAALAQKLGIRRFTTTLASSRWKRLDQIEQAGLWAAQHYPSVEFWSQNWRKGGLQERRNQLLKDFDFYNQLYCGCEFSIRAIEK